MLFRSVFNPDIAVIGDFLGTGGRNGVAPSPALAMHESETSFQAVVDPYARADFFISFGESGVDLEEGYRAVALECVADGYTIELHDSSIKGIMPRMMELLDRNPAQPGR